jgi:hypothetical protein
MGLNNFTTTSGTARFTDIDSDNITNSGQVTTQDLDVTGTATGTAEGFTQTRVFLSADSSADPIPFDGVSFDPDGAFDLSNSAYIAPSSGFYLINLTVRPGSTSNLNIRITINGSDTAIFSDNDSSDTTNTLTDVKQLNQGDSVTVTNLGGGAIKGASDRNTFVSFVRVA